MTKKQCKKHFFFNFKILVKKIASWWHFLSSKKCQNYTWLSINNSTKNSTPKQDFHCIIMSLRYDRKLILKLHTSKIAYWSENAHFYLDVALHKGQLISKCLFGVSNSSKKRLENSNFCHSQLGQNFFWKNWRNQNVLSKLSDL